MERLFNLDAQLLFDACTLAIAMFVLFTLLSYLLFEPVRKMLDERKRRVKEEQDTAKKERADAVVFKEEYETKLKEVDKEAAGASLSEALQESDEDRVTDCCRSERRGSPYYSACKRRG